MKYVDDHDDEGDQYQNSEPINGLLLGSIPCSLSLRTFNALGKPTAMWAQDDMVTSNAVLFSNLLMAHRTKFHATSSVYQLATEFR
jgi:hypothetical protein